MNAVLKIKKREIPRARSAVFVEMAVAALLFFTFVLGTAVMGIANYFSGCLEYTLAESARWAITRQVLPGMDRIHSIEQVIIDNGRMCGLNFDPRRDGSAWSGPDNPHIQICSDLDFDCWKDKISDQDGGLSSWVMYRATHMMNLPLLPPLEIVGQVYRRNESNR